jgi:transcriptional regulator with XRE-family HTH domain
VRPVAQGWKRPYTRVFGRRLRELRLRAGLSQRRLAELVGSNREHIAKLERGLHAPRRERLQQLAEALGVDVAELVAQRDPE